MCMNQEKEDEFVFGSQKDILYLEDVFFVTASSIKKNDEVVRKTFKPLYEHVSFN